MSPVLVPGVCFAYALAIGALHLGLVVGLCRWEAKWQSWAEMGRDKEGRLRSFQKGTPNQKSILWSTTPTERTQCRRLPALYGVWESTVNCSVLKRDRYDNTVLMQSLPCVDYPRSQGLKCEWEKRRWLFRWHMSGCNVTRYDDLHALYDSITWYSHL